MSNDSKTLEAQFEGDSHISSPKFCQILFFFILAYAENFICLASMVKKFEFWRPHFDTSKLWSNFIFRLYLLTLNTSCFQLQRLKTLNFERPRLGVLPIFEPHFLLDLVCF